MGESIRIGSDFEFDGFWWEPTDGPEASKAPGHLSYDPSRGIELSVIDLHSSPHDFFNEDAQAIPALFGANLSGKPCTLFDVLPKDSTFYSASGHSKEVLQSNRLIHGLHLQGIDDLQVDHAVVSVRGLREWVNHRWDGPKQVDDQDGEDGPGDPFKNEVLSVPLDAGSLLIQRGASIGQRRADVPVTAQFKLGERIPYEEFTERFVKPLKDLITLTTRKPTEVEAVTLFFPREEEEKWWGDQKQIQGLEDVEVVERTTLTRIPRREREFALIPMPLRAWGPDAPRIIKCWFEQRANLGGPGNLFFATLGKRDIRLENDVLGLLSVAEGYHRGRFDDPPFTAADHQAALEAMIGALGEQAQSAHYRDRLRHANQQSQKQRIRILYDRAEEVLVEVGRWRKQLQGLIDTRNFLTHWHVPTGSVLEGWDLYAALNRLRVVIEINLYLDLEIDPDVIEVAIRTGNHRRDFMTAP